MFFVAGDNDQSMASGNGCNQGIIVWDRFVFGFGHDPSPFGCRRFIKNVNGFTIVLEDEIEDAFQRQSSLGLAFQFNSPAHFRQGESRDADFSAVRRKPFFDRIPWTKVIAYRVYPPDISEPAWRNAFLGNWLKQKSLCGQRIQMIREVLRGLGQLPDAPA